MITDTKATELALRAETIGEAATEGEGVTFSDLTEWSRFLTGAMVDLREGGVRFAKLILVVETASAIVDEALLAAL